MQEIHCYLQTQKTPRLAQGSYLYILLKLYLYIIYISDYISIKFSNNLHLCKIIYIFIYTISYDVMNDDMTRT